MAVIPPGGDAPKITPEGEGHAAKTTGGPLGIQLPADAGILSTCRVLAADKNVRVEDLATCASQDPAIVIELIKLANAMYYSAGRPPITTTKLCIQRLGSDVVIELLEKLKERPQYTNEDVNHWLDLNRSRLRRISIAAKILAEVNAKTISDDCQTAGLLLQFGEVIAVGHFQEKYVALAEEYSRASLNFRLNQDHKFDTESIGLNYLRRNGIPEVILFALDREASPKSPDRAIMRPICAAAAEMVEAFDSNRWEKLAPGKKLPPMSSLRILGFSDNQYLKVYERISEFLFSVRIAEEKKKNSAIAAVQAQPAAPQPVTKSSQLDDDIQSLISGAIASDPEPEAEDFADEPEVKVETKIKTVTESLDTDLDSFAIKPPGGGEKKVARVESSKAKQIVPPPQMRTPQGNQFVNSVAEMLADADTSEELLAMLLAKLIQPAGPFVRSALIVVSKDRKSAVVVAARGPNVSNGQKLTITDPLSPLASCFSKVQSFGTRSNAKNSPFGSGAYALAPVDADHDTPVALYADCGDASSVSFEARRIFRNVVDVLNQKLPSIPGGIPVELA